MAAEPLVDARATRIRYVVLALTTMVAVLLYLDRICLSFAERYVREDLGLSKTEMSLVLSSFFWTYAIGQLPAGWLSDRFGARLVLALYLALWSTCTGLLGFAVAMTTLVALRLGCGLFEAGAYPAAAGVIGHWMPFQRRGFASGIISVGGRLGGAAAPILTAYLMVAFVPATSSSSFRPDDLLDVPALLREMTQQPTAAKDVLGPKLFERLPDDIKGPILDRRHSKVEHTHDFLTRLAESLNHVLGQADFLDDLNLAALDVPAEALLLLKHSSTARTPEEIQRRNRLVLEAAFPEALRKVYGPGWRPVMMLYGVLGLVVAAIFWWFFRNRPREHPACNSAEVALIEGEGAVVAGAALGPLPFMCLLTSTSLWLMSIVSLLTNFAWVFLITWFPRYLDEMHKVRLVESGWMASLPIFVGMAGMFWGGWLTDYMTTRLGLRWGRCLPMALSRFVVAAAFALCVYLGTPWQVTAALSVVALATDLGTPAMWAYSLDVGGKHVGSVLGWANMFGNIGAAISPIVLNWIIGDKNYDRMFWTCAAVFVVAGVLALFIDATRPVVPAEPLAA